MNVQVGAYLYTGDQAVQVAADYLASVGLYEALVAMPGRIRPHLPDLARLHHLARSRRVFTALEFGVGYSTLVLAHALQANQDAWDAYDQGHFLRNQTPFEFHSVDASHHWLDEARKLLPDSLAQRVHLMHSKVHVGTFQDRFCHFYERLPDAVPDLIYLDGPDPTDVQGEVAGLTWQNRDRVVMSGDLLRLEPLLLPGTLVVVDGRSANAQFLARNFQRQWAVCYSAVGDVTLMELQAPPLGQINEATLLYCLGPRIRTWYTSSLD